MTPTRANGKVNSQNRKIKALAKKIEFLSEKMKELKAKRRKEKEEAVKRKLRNKRIRAEAERKISQHKKDLWSKEMRIKELEKQNSRAKAISKATIKELKKKNEYRKKEIERLKIQIRSAVCQVCLEPFVEKPTPHVLCKSAFGFPKFRFFWKKIRYPVGLVFSDFWG